MAIDAITGIRDIIQAATHLPFVGSKFKGIADELTGVIGKLKGVRDAIGRVHGKHISITVHGDGKWAVIGPGGGLPGGTAGGPFGHAEGWRVPGYGGGDRWPALLEGGESVVPKHLTPAVAPFLKAHGVPGFSKGVVGSYGNGVTGLGPWMGREDAATTRAIEAAVAAAVKAALRSGAGIIPYAESFIGKVPYAWGGTTPGGWDCSGFTGWVYRHFGYDSIPRTSQEQARWVRRTSGPVPGGLAFFAGSDGTSAAPGHVGIVVNGSTMVDAFGTGFGTRLNSLADMVFAGIPPQGFDQGGYLQPGLTLAYNGTGRPEPVGHHMGNSYAITVNVAPGASLADAGRQVVTAIKEFERRSGSGWRS
jgi:cell wall-associated NlpC family hydrolase